MSDAVSIRGLERFARLSKDLRQAGAKELRRELYRGLQRAAKPLIADAKVSARSLPHRGGLADRAARARFRVKARAGRTPSISIVAADAKGRSVDLDALDRGTVRHPTFGHRPWVAQQVRPEWFTRPMVNGSPQVRDEMLRAVDDVAAKFYKH
jgi:hypothetical protein